MNPKLIELFQQMYELTEPECRLTCKCPQSCCSPEYCDMAEEFAAKYRAYFKATNHPRLKFMGPTGCIIPPHFRPLCTFHTCDMNAWGFKPNDPNWTDRYFDIRSEIEKLLMEEGL